MIVWGVKKRFADEIKKRLIVSFPKKYHPDINKEPGAEEKYKEVQEAYETLSDDQNVQPTTSMVAAGANGGFGGAGGFGGFDGAGGSVVLKISSQVFSRRRSFTQSKRSSSRG